MSDIALVNVGQADMLPPAATLRVTFTERYSIMLDRGFAARFADVYAQLKIGNGVQSKFWALNPNSAVAGNAVAVQDIRLFENVGVPQVLATLDAICGWFVKVTKLELLTGSEATDSTTPAGAQERSAAAVTAQQSNDSGSIGAQIGKVLGTTANVVKWLAIAAVVLGVVYLVHEGPGGIAKLAKGAAE